MGHEKPAERHSAHTIRIQFFPSCCDDNHIFQQRCLHACECNTFLLLGKLQNSLHVLQISVVLTAGMRNIQEITIYIKIFLQVTCVCYFCNKTDVPTIVQLSSNPVKRVLVTNCTVRAIRSITVPK
jgi:hypothetical protein